MKTIAKAYEMGIRTVDLSGRGELVLPISKIVVTGNRTTSMIGGNQLYGLLSMPKTGKIRWSFW